MNNVTLQIQLMQEVAYPALQAATIINRTQAAASTIARYIYAADDWFQEEIVPRTYLAIALAAYGCVMAILWTMDAGQKTGEWFRGWFADYVVAAIPGLVEEPQLALAGVAIAGYLPPAPVRLLTEKDEVVKTKTKSKRKRGAQCHTT